MDPSLDEEVSVVPSRHTGTTVIDHIDTYGIPEENVVSAGQLPHGIGFDSDHRCIYADLDIESILGFSMDQYKPRAGRRLKSANKVTTEKYLSSLRESLEAHNIWARVKELWARV